MLKCFLCPLVSVCTFKLFVPVRFVPLIARGALAPHTQLTGNVPTTFINIVSKVFKG